jgi:hypothetical protein
VKAGVDDWRDNCLCQWAQSKRQGREDPRTHLFICGDLQNQRQRPIRRRLGVFFIHQYHEVMKVLALAAHPHPHWI